MGSTSLQLLTLLTPPIMGISQAFELDIYINYPGHCEEAFRFYEKQLDGKITLMVPHEQIPEHFPTEWKKPILHAVVEIGGVRVRGADVPHAEPMRSVYLTLRPDTAERAEAIYQILSLGGEIFMKMEKTFFANRFAMLRDKFGTSWMLLHED